MIKAKNNTLKADAGSAPAAIAHTTVPTAPIATHTAYAVPVGRSRIAHDKPPMLTMTATAKTTDGHKRVNPSDRPNAVAHTASNTPEMTKTIQDTTAAFPGRLVAFRVQLHRPAGVS
jgi:hypothetical protein